MKVIHGASCAAAIFMLWLQWRIDMTSQLSRDPSMNEVIELNVGGSRFMTLRGTLCADPQSTLATMFSSDAAIGTLPKDRHGAVFLDYDPEMFGIVLEHLRQVRRLGKGVVGPLSLQGVYGAGEENRWNKLCLARVCAEFNIVCVM